VGTAKRERQKANRKLRLEELAKEARKQKSKRVFVRIGAVVAAVVVLVGAISLFGGDDSETAATTTTSTSVVVDTLPTSTVPGLTDFGPVPAKPAVSLPAELPTELHVTELRAGSGTATVNGDIVYVHYVGVRSGDGAEFDNSYDRGEPIQVTIGAGGVIPGWDQGLVDLQIGGMYQFDIPSDLAYGDDADPAVAGPLTFVVEVVGIVHADGTVSTLPAGTTDTVADTSPVTEAPATT